MEITSQSKLAVIPSHACAKTVWEHIRNLDDKQVEALKTNQGVIGVNLVWPSISERPSLRTVTDHIIYLWKRFGEDICTIGTDYFGLLDHPEPEGLRGITKFAGQWNELMDSGMRRSVIEKVTGNDALRANEADAQRWR